MRGWHRALVVIAACSAFVAIAAFAILFETYRIPTAAMSPTLPVGSTIVVMRGMETDRGDVVAFRYPKDPRVTYAKRVVAVGGDLVEIRSKRLFIDGSEVSEPFVVHSDARTLPNGEFLPEPYRSRDHFGPLRIPNGELFMLGDNRDASSDSRFRGTVPRGNLIGRVVLVFTWKDGLRRP